MLTVLPGAAGHSNRRQPAQENWGGFIGRPLGWLSFRIWGEGRSQLQTPDPKRSDLAPCLCSRRPWPPSGARLRQAPARGSVQSRSPSGAVPRFRAWSCAPCCSRWQRATPGAPRAPMAAPRRLRQATDGSLLPSAPRGLIGGAEGAGCWPPPGGPDRLSLITGTQRAGV